MKVIRYRFSDEIIKKLLEIDYQQVDEAFIKEHQDLLNTKMDESNVDIILKSFPKSVLDKFDTNISTEG